MFAEIRTAINNPFDQRHFYLLFIVALPLLLLPIIVINFMGKVSLSCDPTQLNFSGNMDSGEGKVFEFTYKGPSSCNIVISPQWNPAEKTSLWVYKPDKTVVVTDSPSLSKKGRVILTSGEKGTYRLSIHNKNNSNINYKLLVSLIEK